MAKAAGLEFWWHRNDGGYKIEDRPIDGEPDEKEPVIVPREGKNELYQLVTKAQKGHIFEDLANSDRSHPHPDAAKQALAFTSKWGFLFRLVSPDEGMNLSDFFGYAHYFRDMLTLARRKNYKDMISNTHRIDDITGRTIGTGRFTLDVQMLADAPTDKPQPRMFFQPQSLVSFAIYDLWQAVTHGAEVRLCAREKCKNFIAVGNGSPLKHCRRGGCRQAVYRGRTKNKKQASEAPLPVVQTEAGLTTAEPTSPAAQDLPPSPPRRKGAPLPSPVARETKAQHAMAVAWAHRQPTAYKRGGAKFSLAKKLAEDFGVSDADLSMARTVWDYDEELGMKVMNGLFPLRRAYDEAKAAGIVESSAKRQSRHVSRT